MKIDYEKYPLPRRLRHHVSPNLYFPYEKQDAELKSYPKPLEKLDLEGLFADGRPPQAIDAGCGKGKFLIDYCEAGPETNTLGIELRRPLVEWINNFASSESIGNCAAIWQSLVNGMEYIESDSIEEIFYLFPDPWHKKRHRKRRAFNNETIAEFYRILRPGGKLYLATDVPHVDKHHEKLLGEFGKFDYRRAGEEDWNLPTTNKESFCMRKNIKVFRLIAEKPAPGSRMSG